MFACVTLTTSDLAAPIPAAEDPYGNVVEAP
jgi:hypothetical protein